MPRRELLTSTERLHLLALPERDAFAAIEEIFSWETFSESVKEAAKLGFSAPAMPATTVAQANSVLNGAVEVIITAIGTVSALTVNQPGTGGAYTLTGALTLGQRIRLEPGDTITLTYTVAPTWRWTPT